MELNEREKRQKEVYSKAADILLNKLDRMIEVDGVVVDPDKVSNLLDSISWLEHEVDRLRDIEDFIPPKPIEEPANPRDYIPPRLVRRRRHLC